MLLLFCWPGKFNYANCRNTGTLAGDLAATKFVLFLTKIESYIIWKEFLNCSNDKLKFKFISITARKCNTFSHQYSYGFWPWFPAPSLGHWVHNLLYRYSHTDECGSKDLGYPARLIYPANSLQHAAK